MDKYSDELTQSLPEYAKLLDEDSTGSKETLLSDINLRGRRQYWTRRSWLHIAELCVCTLSIVCLAFSIALYRNAIDLQDNSPGYTIAELENEVGKVRQYKFKGAIDAPSPYKGPFEETDAAWSELTQIDGVIKLDHDQMIQAGGSEASVRIPDEYGGGYMGFLELPHQIHCLRELYVRTFSSFWENSTAAEELGGSFEMDRMHLDHCADMLRQKLLCDADTTLITYNWRTHLSHATPNFSTMHKCRDHEALYRWLDKNKFRKAEKNFVKPADAIDLDYWPGTMP